MRWENASRSGGLRQAWIRNSCVRTMNSGSSRSLAMKLVGVLARLTRGAVGGGVLAELFDVLYPCRGLRLRRSAAAGRPLLKRAAGGG